MNLTVKEAADFLGVSVGFIRMGLEQGTLPIGCRVVTEKGSNVYHISKEATETYKKYGTRPIERIVYEIVEKG